MYIHTRMLYAYLIYIYIYIYIIRTTSNTHTQSFEPSCVFCVFVRHVEVMPVLVPGRALRFYGQVSQVRSAKLPSEGLRPQNDGLSRHPNTPEVRSCRVWVQFSRLRFENRACMIIARDSPSALSSPDVSVISLGFLSKHATSQSVAARKGQL